LKILFIWYGLREPLYTFRHECIKRAMELYPEAEFQCITHLEKFYGMEIISPNKIQSQMLKTEGSQDTFIFACILSLCSNLISKLHITLNPCFLAFVQK